MTAEQKKQRAAIARLLRTHPERMASRLTYGGYGRIIVSLMGFGYRYGTAWTRFMRPVGLAGAYLAFPAALMFLHIRPFDLNFYFPEEQVWQIKLYAMLFYSLWLHAALIHFPARLHDTLWRLMVSRGRAAPRKSGFAASIMKIVFPETLERMLTRLMAVLSPIFIYDLWRRVGDIGGGLRNPLDNLIGSAMSRNLDTALMAFSFYFAMVVLVGLFFDFTERILLRPGGNQVAAY